jgi:hypothetical protein
MIAQSVQGLGYALCSDLFEKYADPSILTVGTLCFMLYVNNSQNVIFPL